MKVIVEEFRENARTAMKYLTNWLRVALEQGEGARDFFLWTLNSYPIQFNNTLITCITRLNVYLCKDPTQESGLFTFDAFDESRSPSPQQHGGSYGSINLRGSRLSVARLNILEDRH